MPCCSSCLCTHVYHAYLYNFYFWHFVCLHYWPRLNIYININCISIIQNHSWLPCDLQEKKSRMSNRRHVWKLFYFSVHCTAYCLWSIEIIEWLLRTLVALLRCYNRLNEKFLEGIIKLNYVWIDGSTVRGSISWEFLVVMQCLAKKFACLTLSN